MYCSTFATIFGLNMLVLVLLAGSWAVTFWKVLAARQQRRTMVDVLQRMNERDELRVTRTFFFVIVCFYASYMPDIITRTYISVHRMAYSVSREWPDSLNVLFAMASLFLSLSSVINGLIVLLQSADLRNFKMVRWFRWWNGRERSNVPEVQTANA